MITRIAILGAMVDSCDTASFGLFHRMSPTAVLSSALLHVGVAAMLVTSALPRIHPHDPGRTIELTIDLPSPLPAARPTMAADPVADPSLPAQRRDAPPSAPSRAVVAPAPLEQVLPPVEPSPPVTAAEIAAIAPAPVESAVLKRALPPVDPPPPPVSAREIVAVMSPATPNPNAAHAQERPSPPPAPAPATRPVRHPASGEVRGAARSAPNPAPRSAPRAAARLAIDAARASGLRQAREDYLRQLVRKLSHVRFSQASPETSARGLVVMRLTVSRDGRLVDESLARSSGFPELDRGVMEAVRKASPFAPLPADLGQDRYTFMVPINYVRDR